MPRRNRPRETDCRTAGFPHDWSPPEDDGVKRCRRCGARKRARAAAR